MTSTSWVLFLWPGLDKNLCWLWINTAVYELCPLLGSMLWKHKPTNRTQTYSETHCVHTHACIIQEECTNKNRVWKRWHFWSRYGSRKDPPLLYFHAMTFPVESLAPVTADTPLTGWNDESPRLCLLVSSRKRKQSVSFRSEIRNHSFSGSPCVTLVFQPVWILTVSGCAVSSPPLSLTLPAEIVSFQVNLNSVLHFLWYMASLSCMETLRPPLPWLCLGQGTKLH